MRNLDLEFDRPPAAPSSSAIADTGAPAKAPVETPEPPKTTGILSDIFGAADPPVGTERTIPVKFVYLGRLKPMPIDTLDDS